MTRAHVLALPLTLVASALGWGCREHPSTAPAPAPAPAAEWEVLASELPSAMLSVSGRSATDVYAVGADKGHGPFALHFDGKAWTELHTGQTGDLWWVQALAAGPTLMGGANAMVLRYDGQRFERLKTPGVAKQTVYGVWGTSADDLYAVGNTAGHDGFIWHYRGGAFATEPLPADLPRASNGELPGFFKVWGDEADVWVVGTAGTILHRSGAAPFARVPSGTKETLFTVHGAGGRLLAVGGTGNGVLLEGARVSQTFHDGSPASAGLLQGVFATDHGDWASGERATVFARPPGAAAFTAVEHGLALAATSSFHSIFVDPSGGVWSAGGNVMSTALDDGMLVHYGKRVPPVILDDEPADAGAPAAR
jgi:hypothetical protein